MRTKTVGKKAAENAQQIERAIRDFVRDSPLNHMPHDAAQPIFGEPLVRYADANDVLFTQFKTIIAPVHLTPREALALAPGKKTRSFRRALRHKLDTAGSAEDPQIKPCRRKAPEPPVGVHPLVWRAVQRGTPKTYGNDAP